MKRNAWNTKTLALREYWIVDPKTESVLCYFFEESDEPHSYTFDDKIPVRIYDNNLVINFAEIKERLSKPLPDDFSLIVLIIPEHSCWFSSYDADR